MIIAVDIDDCVIPMRRRWIAYCEENFWHVKCPILSYNLCDYWGEKAMDFWSQESLYDDLEPDDKAKECLDWLNEKGHEIGFVSYTKKGHYSSKCNFINRWFPYRKFILNTKEKNYTRCDWFIDDRSSNLIDQPGYVRTILLKTSCADDGTHVHFVAEDWNEIMNIFKKGV